MPDSDARTTATSAPTSPGFFLVVPNSTPLSFVASSVRGAEGDDGTEWTHVFNQAEDGCIKKGRFLMTQCDDQTRDRTTRKQERGVRAKQRENRRGENEHKGFLAHESEVDSCSGNAKAESHGKGVWYPKELDRDLWSSFRASIACQALGPGKTPVCSFGTRDQSDRRRLSRWSRFSEFDIDALMTKEFHHLPPMEAALPVSPKHRIRSRWR